METKAIGIELKDIDKGKREVTFAHAAYDNIDLAGDISRKGMFDKTWKETKDDVNLYLNHDDTQAPGKIIKLFDDQYKAYTTGKMGTHTLGNDVLIMADEGIIKKASFGFIATKAPKITVKARSIRELKEVAHLESSVLTKMPCNPETGIMSVTKAFDRGGLVIDFKSLQPIEQTFLKNMIAGHQGNLEKLVNFQATLPPESDLYTTTNYWIQSLSGQMSDMKSSLKWNTKSAEMDSEVKAHLDNMKKFCRDTTASDGTILNIMAEIKSIEDSFNTADTQLIIEPSASEETERESKAADSLYLLTLNF